MESQDPYALARRAWNAACKATPEGEPAGAAPLDIIKECIELGMDLNARAWAGGGPTALDGAIYAEGGSRMGIVRYLLEQGADANAFGYEDGTMLMAAALLSNLEAIELLLAHGADPNLTHPTTLEAPLHSVTAKGFNANANAAAARLLDQGANPNAKAANGVPTAIYYRDITVIGETPLHRAAAYCDGDMIQLLLDRGADPSIKDAHGESALTWFSRHQRTVEHLVVARSVAKHLEYQ